MSLKGYFSNLGYLLTGVLFLHLLNPYDLAPVFAYLLIVVYALNKKKEFYQNLDFESFLLLTFGFTYSAFDFFGDHKGFQYLIMQAIFPSFFYLLGKSMVFKTMKQGNIIALVLLLGFVYSSTAILSVGNDLMKGGFNQVGRLINNYWSNKGTKATFYSVFLVYNMAIPVILMASSKLFHIKYKILILLSYAISLLCIFRLGSRTGIAITIITTLLGLFILFAQQNLKQNLRLIFVLAATLFLFFYFNPVSIESEIFSTLGHRLQNKNTSSAETAGGRTVLWANGLDNLVKHPLGWTSKKHAHNLWLDMAKVAGILPLIFFLVFNLKNINMVFKLIKVPKSENILPLKIALGLFTFGALTTFFTEPVLQGSFFVVTFYCLIQGILKKSYAQIDSRK